MKISIIILTRNGRITLPRALDKIFGQKPQKDIEVIAIDSGSTDGTLKLLKNYQGLQVYNIPPAEFSHSRTRNLGVCLAKGEYVVFLSQDAEPVDENWLENLLTPLLKDDSVGAAYGKQVPAAGADPVNSFRMQWIYRGEALLKSRDSAVEFSRMIFQFSDVNSIVRRELLLRFPFPEDLELCEDVYLAKQLLDNGYKIAYSATAAVIHSHNHSLMQMFSRYFDVAVAYEKIGVPKQVTKIGSEGRRYVREEFGYLLRNGHWIWVPYAIINNIFKYAGFRIGCSQRLLPAGLKRRISTYWYK